MSEVARVIAGAMQADAAALRAISQNIANADVPAYRRQMALSASSSASFQQILGAHESPAQAAAARWEGVDTDETPGVLKSTGEPLHLAIEGPGYFRLQSETGTLLTRRGDFHVSASGVLTAASGEVVLGANGPMELGIAIPSIATDGTVSVAGDVVDQLSVVTVPPAARLQYVGNGLYELDAAEAVALEQISIRQGFLEAANVTPVQEMVRMMETLRHFETAQRFLLGYDQLQQSAISELGRVD
jgi:flagellar basal-body rod protein FlgF